MDGQGEMEIPITSLAFQSVSLSQTNRVHVHRLDGRVMSTPALAECIR